VTARRLLESIVACASAPRSSASRNLMQVVDVPASQIEIARDFLRGPTPEGKRYLRKLMRNVFYGPNHATSMRWTVCARKIVNDALVMLGACGDEYAVFTFWIPRIGPKMCPADKFTSGAKRGMALYREICAKEARG
jgi:hypothetical protein